MRYQSWSNLPEMFFEQAAARADGPFLWAKANGTYQPVSWGKAARHVAALARGLAALGIGPGDRVALVAENRPEWPIADIAIMTAGAITVPSYVTNGTDDHLHVLRDSGAKGCIVSTAALAERVMPAAKEAAALDFVIAIESLQSTPDGSVPVHRWKDVIAAHAGAVPKPEEIAARQSRSDTACLIYTSGTGGAPKGVMLSHGAILHNCKGSYGILHELGLDDEVFLSFLPLSHSYEHTAGQFFPISIGAQIYYSDADSLLTNLTLARPTLMTAVPRLYESLRERMNRDVKRAGGINEKLFLRALALGRAKYENGGRLPIGARAQDFFCETLVRRKVHQRLGGRLKGLISGGAPLNYEVGLFFTALGVRLLQGYGQTEAAPVISCNAPSGARIETVGPPMEDVELRIADDGEILVRGELVMQGYWGNPEATREALIDGWLHTGDVGEIDADGHLRITDRKKDIIVNSGGDNVSPQRIEGFLTFEPEIAQAMVYGDKRPHLVGLIVPDAEFAKNWAKGQETKPGGKRANLAELITDRAFRDRIQEAVERVNRKLTAIERVRRFELIAYQFSIDNGLMTPTMKIRRHKITEAYGAALEALYHH